MEGFVWKKEIALKYISVSSTLTGDFLVYSSNNQQFTCYDKREINLSVGNINHRCFGRSIREKTLEPLCFPEQQERPCMSLGYNYVKARLHWRFLLRF